VGSSTTAPATQADAGTVHVVDHVTTGTASLSQRVLTKDTIGRVYSARSHYEGAHTAGVRVACVDGTGHHTGQIY
jgi:hypothetical protein